MNALLPSTGVVALAEMGDKTQLLAFLLAARFRKPVPIIVGILAATLLNHGLAGAVGAGGDGAGVAAAEGVCGAGVVGVGVGREGPGAE